MNHTATINIWKKTNRVSRLWDDLAEDRVAPDPRSMDVTSPVVDPKSELPAYSAPDSDIELRSPLETGSSLFPGPWEEIEIEEKSYLEQVGLESIHLIKHALDVLTAPPDEVLMPDPVREKDPEGWLPSEEVEKTRADPDLFPAMIKVSFESDPQPTSAIETRRMAYGLKIPPRPLHKRPIYQRLFFCLHIWVGKAFGKRYIP